MRLPDNGRYSHPKVRPSSHRMFLLDEAQPGSAFDVVTGEELDDTDVAIAAAPPIIDSSTGRGLRFTDSALDQSLAGAIPTDDSRDVVEGNWTAGVLVRPRTPENTSSFFSFTGTSGSALAVENFLMRLGTDGSGHPLLRWENGGGTGVTTTATDYILERNEWVYLLWRKTLASTPGPVGTCTLELFINGALVETFLAVPNSSDGGNARWNIGGERTAASIAIEPDADLAGCYFWGAPLTQDEIEEDIRRIRGQTFFMRIDARVDVDDQDGFLRDVTSFDGVDFLDSVDVTDQIDNATMTATVKLLREQEGMSLAGLVTSSPQNVPNRFDPETSFRFLVINDRIEILAARIPLGLRAGEDDWFSIFSGRMDEVDDGGEVISISARDEGGQLINTFIEEVLEYGDDPAVAVEGEMQGILDDNDGDAGTIFNSIGYPRVDSFPAVTLFTPVSPGFDILPFEQRREAVLSGLRQLAGLIGWECRYRYDQDPLDPGWKLTFYEPRRDRAINGDVDTIINPDEILEVSSFKRTIFGRRTNCRVAYRSSETILPTPPTPPTGYSVVDQGWVNVDGEDERTMAYIHIQSDVALAAIPVRQFMEMSEVSSGQIDSLPEAFDMCLGSLQDTDEIDLAKRVTLPAYPEMQLNDIVRLGPNKQLATGAQRLAAKSITISLGAKATTTVEFRGKPAAGFRRWLRMETRNGRAGAIDPTQALSDRQLTALLSTQRAMYTRTRQFRNGIKYLAILNAAFEDYGLGRANEPEGWLMTAGTWDTDIRTSQAFTRTGRHVIELLTSAGELTCDPFSIEHDDDQTPPLSFEMQWLRADAVVTVPVMRINWLDEDELDLGGATTLTPGGAGTPDFPAEGSGGASVWFASRVDGVQPPSGARLATITLSQGDAPDTEIFIDRVTGYRTSRASRAVLDAVTGWGGIGHGAGGPAHNIALSDVTAADTYDRGLNIFVDETTPPDAFGHHFLVKEPGTYEINIFQWFVESFAATQSSDIELQLVRNGTYDSSANRLTGVVIGAERRVVSMVVGVGQEPICLTHVVNLNTGDRLTPDFLYRSGAGTVNRAVGLPPGRLSYWQVKLRGLD